MTNKQNTNTGREHVDLQIKRAIPSAINTPTTVRVHRVNDTTSSEAERILTSFIDASEINISGKGTAETNTTGISGGNESPAIVSQLKRIQRSLRGLPPLMSEEQFTKSNASLEDSERPNKRSSLMNLMTIYPLRK